jgi:hypothetical protein
MVITRGKHEAKMPCLLVWLQRGVSSHSRRVLGQMFRVQDDL